MERVLPRVVAIGFNKCGTRSLAELFRRAGHPVVHHKVRDRWPIPRRIGKIMRDNLTAGRPVFETADSYTFYCDLIDSTREGSFDGATAFREILRDYPGTIFILNIRDQDDWITSRLNHGHGEFAKREMLAGGYAHQDELINHWRMRWDKHLAAVRRFSADNPGRVIEFNIDTDDPRTIVEQLPDYVLKPEDFYDVGRSRGRNMALPLRWLKRFVAHLRPRFFS
jgi:hypothetical protein